MAEWDDFTKNWKTLQVVKIDHFEYCTILHVFIKLVCCVSVYFHCHCNNPLQETYSELRQQQNATRQLESKCQSASSKHKKMMDDMVAKLRQQ